MRFEITAYDDHGTPSPADPVDLPTLRELLDQATTTGQRLHIRPRPRPTERSEEPRP